MPLPVEGLAPGYATDRRGRKVCYACCGEQDRKDMLRTGRAVLYLTMTPEGAYLTNWPGTLRFECGPVRKGSHNMARVRYDVWFTGPDGNAWHGVQYGDNTQLCHTRRAGARK